MQTVVKRKECAVRLRSELIECDPGRSRADRHAAVATLREKEKRKKKIGYGAGQ